MAYFYIYLRVGKTKNTSCIIFGTGDDQEIAKRIQMTFGGGVDGAMDFVNLPSTQRRLFYSLDQVIYSAMYQ